MAESIEIQGWLAKSIESLATATSEVANERYNSAANRLYYAAFQAAIAALLRAGIQTPNARGKWDHGFVQGEFSKLLRRRKTYPSEFARELGLLFPLRERGDYQSGQVNRVQVSRALERTRRFVEAIVRGGESQ